MKLYDLLNEIADYCSKNTNEFLSHYYNFKEDEILAKKINKNKNFVIKIEYKGKESFGSCIEYIIIGCDIINRMIYTSKFYISEDDYDNYFQDESGDED